MLRNNNGIEIPAPRTLSILYLRCGVQTPQKRPLFSTTFNSLFEMPLEDVVYVCADASSFQFSI